MESETTPQLIAKKTEYGPDESDLWLDETVALY